MAGPSEGDDAIWRETVTLALWELIPSGGRFCRPRCYAPFSPAHGQDSVVRCDRPHSRHRRIPSSGPDDPSFAACHPGPFTEGDGMGFSSPMDRSHRRTGLPPNSVPPVLRAGPYG
ncbi:hypothetical protein PY793_10960 [Acetobacter fabarum]|uniref:hypothetical protein n=1 Tax=Acetobacteraceae TaxID=433 RepID=UPI001297572A|nr:hypothetical protein [Komagataeibacter medellinensis]